MHKLVALSFGLLLGLSTLTSVNAEAGNGWYRPPTTSGYGYGGGAYCPPSFSMPEPNWSRYRETGGYYKWHDYHEHRGSHFGNKSWRTGSYQFNGGSGQFYDDHGEEHFRAPGWSSQSSPIFP